MWTFFFVLAGLIVMKGVFGVIEGIRYRRYIRRHLESPQNSWMPPACVILPCKGLDYQLEENVRAVLNQDYPSYEVILVTAQADDSALPLLRRVTAAFPQQTVRFVVAGLSDARGEKVNNLLEALKHVSATTQVYVFTDSDSRPHKRWLRDLIAPLQTSEVGISTGYRWYFPERGNVASVVRAAWNGSIATLLGNHRRNFTWGGSMALRRETFDRARVPHYWEHSISDDFSITQAIRDSGLRIHYEPRCLIGSYGDCDWSELLRWSTRQILITKVYSRGLWKAAMISQFSFVLVWWASVVLGAWIIVGGLWLLGAIRGWLRLESVKQIHPRERSRLNRDAWAHILLPPLTSTLTAYNLLLSLFSSTVTWRGVRYELKSPRELRVIRSQAASVADN